MALILPKGIVVNSPEIEGNIERTDNEPLDLADIAKLWKVYTTTKRRLLDPTAERLENYWWRIWGSKRRKLNGATLARLFAQISDGQSFVPLRGPPNRDEGTPPLNTNTRLGPGASSTTALHHPNQNQSRPSTTSSSATSKAPAPMPHPILKKSRGPSASGPRPTARFISPHESEDDSDPTSSISPNSHVVVEPPSPDSQSLKSDNKSDNKSTAAHAKKRGGFVASNSAKKKTRPVIVRRQSSQTSQSSTEGAIRASEMEQSPAPAQSSSERTPPTFSTQTQTHDKQNAQSRFQENFSPSPDRGASSSKSPKTKSRTLDPKRLSPRKSSTRPRKDRTAATETLEETIVSTGDPGPSTQLRRVENLRAPPVSTEELTPEELEELEMQRTLLEEANARKESGSTPLVLPPTTSEGFQVIHSSLRLNSDGSHGSDGIGAMRLLPHDTKSTASLAPTLTAATGQLDLGEEDLLEPQQPVSDRSPVIDKGKGRGSEQVRHTDMFAKRPVPPVQVATGPDPSAPLSRSKSQLTLLLERDRARSDEVEHGGGKSFGKKS